MVSVSILTVVKQQFAGLCCTCLFRPKHAASVGFNACFNLNSKTVRNNAELVQSIGTVKEDDHGTSFL